MTDRTRTYTWENPMLGAEAALTLSGLEYLQKVARRELPWPAIAQTMGMESMEIAEGRATFHATPQEWHYNPIGTVHGGFAATLLDSALGCSIHTTLAAGTAYTTLELHVNYIRAITAETGPMSCTGEVIHVGRTQATAQARLVDASGKLYAHGTTTCLIMKLPG